MTANAVETAEVIRAVLGRLPESYRAVLIHRYINGDSTRETAKETLDLISDQLKFIKEK